MRVTRFWHRGALATIADEDFLWFDQPNGDVPQRISFADLKTAIAGGGGDSPFVELDEATYTLSDDDNGKVFYSTAACTVTLPSGLTAGLEATFIQATADVLTLSPSNPAAINGAQDDVTPSAQFKAIYLGMPAPSLYLAVL